MGRERLTVYTIGHSNHPIERFIGLLDGAGIKSVTDVRTAPVSRYCPQFNKAPLTASLKAQGIGYDFAGDVLGGRPKDESLWRDGRPDYHRMIATEGARVALEGVASRTATAPLAMMCSEKEPLECHRCLMVARKLAAEGVDVLHILADGSIEPQANTEDRLMAWADKRQPELFQTPAERLASAYEARADWLWQTGPSKSRRR